MRGQMEACGGFAAHEASGQVGRAQISTASQQDGGEAGPSPAALGTAASAAAGVKYLDASSPPAQAELQGSRKD